MGHILSYPFLNVKASRHLRISPRHLRVYLHTKAVEMRSAYKRPHETHVETNVNAQSERILSRSNLD